MLVTIRKFSILQTGKFLAVLYGFFSLILLPIFLIGLIFEGPEAFGLLLMAILYPVMGFIGGIVGAFVYNLASKFVGGLEVTLEASQTDSPSTGNPSIGTGF